MARNINMKVNTAKTQMLCIHPFNSELVSTYITTSEGVLKSGDTLKILGFTFNKKPDTSFHVKQVVNKLYGML